MMAGVRTTLLPVIVLCSLMLPCARGAFASEPGEVMIDSVAVLVNPVSTDGSQSTLVLASDIELVVRLILISKHRQEWDGVAVTEAMKRGGRRVAVLVQLMSRMASSLGEQVDRGKVGITEKKLEIAAGGKVRLDGILSASGVGREELRFWLASFQLARKQLEYLTIHAAPLTNAQLEELFNKGGHRFEGAEYAQAKDAFRKLVESREKQALLGKWLDEILKTGKVTFAR